MANCISLVWLHISFHRFECFFPQKHVQASLQCLRMVTFQYLSLFDTCYGDCSPKAIIVAANCDSLSALSRKLIP